MKQITTALTELKSRLVRLNSRLYKFEGHAIMKPMNPYYASKFFPSSLMLSEEKNLAWCQISQVGGKPWKNLFKQLANQSIQDENLESVKGFLKENKKSKPNERMHKIKG